MDLRRRACSAPRSARNPPGLADRSPAAAGPPSSRAAPRASTPPFCTCCPPDWSPNDYLWHGAAQTGNCSPGEGARRLHPERGIDIGAMGKSGGCPFPRRARLARLPGVARPPRPPKRPLQDPGRPAGRAGSLGSRRPKSRLFGERSPRKSVPHLLPPSTRGPRHLSIPASHVPLSSPLLSPARAPPLSSRADGR